MSWSSPSCVLGTELAPSPWQAPLLTSPKSVRFSRVDSASIKEERPKGNSQLPVSPVAEDLMPPYGLTP